MVIRLRNINPIQCAIVLGVIYALLGAIVALLLAPITSFMAAHALPGVNPGPMPGIGMLVVFPVLYGILGFIAGLVTAFLYNLVSHWTGGVELTFDTLTSSMVSAATLVP